MKIIDKIHAAEHEGRPTWSFEYTPPRTDLGVINLFDRMERMAQLGPEFIDITWNAGGITSDLTIELCQASQQVYGLETCMHLTCTNMPREKIDIALEAAKAAGLQNILALRGDAPKGQKNWTAVDTGFSYASDLVKYIKEKYGDYFCISVAGYVEGHPECSSREEDLKYLKMKVDAGADYIVTQFFYDTDLFIDWVKACRAYGITCPILPGMMIIQGYDRFKRMITLAKTQVPQHIHDALEPIKHDDQAVKDYGVSMMIDMCKHLLSAGISEFHFYTGNLEKSARLILEGLGFVAELEKVRKLPWSPSLGPNGRGEKESVRPIFWRNRPKSYISRTQDWDEFPNGRWGDSRSPAFGNIDNYGLQGVFALKYPAEECLKMWRAPETVADVCSLFKDYISGVIASLPWCDSPLQAESRTLTDRLLTLNTNAFLTINSQPAIDGALSSDKTYGWGPKNGFVYQKAYIELFLSPKAFEVLMDKIGSVKYPYITFYGVNLEGDLKTNSKGESPNAVTWGVFPGREIIQPTVVESGAFLAWKEEAFELWSQWATLYEKESPSALLLHQLKSSYFLVNLVDNNFKSRFALFDLLDEVNQDLQAGISR